MAWTGPVSPVWAHVNPDRQKAQVAHGIILGFAFAFLFPLGAILIRTASFRGLVWIHAAIQVFAWILALAGLGLGVYIAIYPMSQLKASNGHPIIGIIVIGAFAVQPISGLIHHYMYKKYQRSTLWSTTHVWWGRIILTLGIINGGLGLMLSGNTVKGEIAYGVVAGVMWLIWMVVAVWGHLKSRGTSGETGEKAMGHSDAATSPDRYNNQDSDA